MRDGGGLRIDVCVFAKLQRILEVSITFYLLIHINNIKHLIQYVKRSSVSSSKILDFDSGTDGLIAFLFMQLLEYFEDDMIFRESFIFKETHGPCSLLWNVRLIDSVNDPTVLELFPFPLQHL